MKRRTKAEWIALVNEYYTSGQEQKKWCESHGIKLLTFQDQVRKLRKAGVLVNQKSTVQNDKSLKHTDVITFVELKESLTLGSIEGNQSESIQIKIGKAKISVPRNFEADKLKDVLKAVCEIC